MNTLTDFLTSIGIEDEPTQEPNGKYVMSLDEFDDFANYSSALDKSGLVEEENNGDTPFTSNKYTLRYSSDDYKIILTWDNEADSGKLTIEER